MLARIRRASWRGLVLSAFSVVMVRVSGVAWWELVVLLDGERDGCRCGVVAGPISARRAPRSDWDVFVLLPSSPSSSCSSFNGIGNGCCRS